MQNQTYVEKKNTHPLEVPLQTPQEAVVTLPGLMPTSPMDWPVERFTQALDRRENNRRALLKWISDNLKQGIDFGRIHAVGKDKCSFARDGRVYECDNPRHWSKPSLWKPGAEKICGMLGLIPRFPNLREYETAALTGTDIKVILIKCELHTNSGFVAAEGTGARSLAQDSGDINKSLKMAEKSSLTSMPPCAWRACPRFSPRIWRTCSRAFGRSAPTIPARRSRHRTSVPATAPLATPGPSRPPRPPEKPACGQSSRNNGPAINRQRSQPIRPITASQGNGADQWRQPHHGQAVFKFIMDLMKQASMTKGELNKHCIEAYGSVVDHISRGDASSLIDWLRSR